WSKRFSILRLALITTFSSASPKLTNPHTILVPNPLDAESRSLGLAAAAALRAGGGYVVPRASHLVRDARPGRILLATQQVMSLRREHYSNTSDLVSHANNQVQQRGRLQRLHPWE